MTQLAEVRLWGERVGALAYEPETKISTFEYAPLWLKHGVEIAPLRMPNSPQKYQFPGLNSKTYKRLPAVFADVLPDDFGNAVIDAWLARNGRDATEFTSLERLLYTGKRGMGAIEFFPALEENSFRSNLDIASLVEMAQAVLDQRNSLSRALSPDLRNDHTMLSLLQVGTSAGGARAKALIAINTDRTIVKSGQVPALEGFEHYLLKFDGIEEHRVSSETFGDPKGYGAMEYAYYLMAKDVGITIHDSELLIEGDRAHFMTKRFDRVGNRKLHVTTLCAMDHADYNKPGSYSYEQLLAVARKLKLPREDAIEIYRRMVFNVIARNHDDHTKNTSFTLDSLDGEWRLSPAYDLAYSYRKDSPWIHSHQMSINGKRENFVKDDLIRVGSLISNFSQESETIIKEVLHVVSNWRGYARKAGVFKGLEAEVQRNLRLQL